MEVTCTKFFMVNGISIFSLWNIQLTFEQEGFRCNVRRGRVQGLRWCFNFCNLIENEGIMANS